ncbi:MAG: zinc ribbon domain-containing protein, partial [Candidatus Magasanikbacteria bacterium]|nr:zinc ribbon domain-containing protein [Candidatus Magasanikbacteria bacterium]
GTLYNGQHQPLVSEEIFSLAQKIHQNKVKKFRVCKNFIFGGLINCVECGSKMTTCFTNKWHDGKMRRYRYYRCTSTMKHNWQACSVKQMSAERLENFCVESLDRIAHDTNYIENMVYRLNNDPEMGLSSPQGVGFELKRNWSKLSTADVAATLNFFLSELKSSTGIAQNLLAKQCFQKIAYSPKSIEISMVYRQGAVTTSVLKPQTPLMAGSCENVLTTSSQPVVWLPGSDSNRRPIGYTYLFVSKKGGLYHHPN